MKTITLLLAIFCLTHQPSNARHYDLTTHATPSSHLGKPKVKNFVAIRKDGRIQFQWGVEQNAQVSMFEMEKSDDGKNFVTAAIIFGTDNDQLTDYSFIDKGSRKKMYYRLKVINKNGDVEKGEVVEVK